MGLSDQAMYEESGIVRGRVAGEMILEMGKWGGEYNVEGVFNTRVLVGIHGVI